VRRAANNEHEAEKMADISASMVMELRQRTGLGMMECKRALTEAEGDLTKAEELLRIKSGAKASKAAGRVAAEGVVGAYITPDGKSGAMVEVNCETDFVSRNEDFIAFARKLAQLIVDRKPADVAALSALPQDGGTVESVRQALVQKLGENISLRRFARVDAQGRLASYSGQGTTYKQEVRRVTRARRTLGQKLNRDPNVEEIAVEAGITPEKVTTLLELVQEHVSLDTPIGDGESVISDVIEDENAIAPEAINSDRSRSAELARAMLRLNPRQQRVLTERFGLKDGKPKTLEEVGVILGITRERVRQLETRALRELRTVAPSLELYLRT